MLDANYLLPGIPVLWVIGDITGLRYSEGEEVMETIMIYTHDVRDLRPGIVSPPDALSPVVASKVGDRHPGGD